MGRLLTPQTPFNTFPMSYSLYRSIIMYLPISHFIILSEREDAVHFIPLIHKWPSASIFNLTNIRGINRLNTVFKSLDLFFFGIRQNYNAINIEAQSLN